MTSGEETRNGKPLPEPEPEAPQIGEYEHFAAFAVRALEWGERMRKLAIDRRRMLEDADLIASRE